MPLRVSSLQNELSAWPGLFARALIGHGRLFKTSSGLYYRGLGWKLLVTSSIDSVGVIAQGRMVTLPWYNNFLSSEGREPVVVVHSVRNRSHEHIEVNTFINDICRAMLMTGDLDRDVWLGQKSVQMVQERR